jgi:hypothetical protein
MRVLPAILFLLLAACLHAHSIHTSTAEAEYNPQTKKLEVTLTVFISDLELAIIRQSERDLRINKTPAAEFDVQIQAYLARTFVLTDAAGKVAKIAWVGREMEADSAKGGDPAVRLFFEMKLPAGLHGLSLRFAVLNDLFKDQTNLLHLRHGSHQSEWRFVRDEPLKALSPL